MALLFQRRWRDGRFKTTARPWVETPRLKSTAANAAKTANRKNNYGANKNAEDKGLRVSVRE